MSDTLRASVTAAAIGLPTGSDTPILIDGADTPVTARGLTGYTPTPGDRLLVQQVGQTLEVIQFLSLGSIPNTGNKVFRQPTTPSATAAGDQWYNTSTPDNVLAIASAPGTLNWVVLQFGANALLTGVLGGKTTPINTTTTLDWGVPNPSAALSSTPTMRPEVLWALTDALPGNGTYPSRFSPFMDGTALGYIKATPGPTRTTYQIANLNLSTGVETLLGSGATVCNGPAEQCVGVVKVGGHYWTLSTQITSGGSLQWKLRDYGTTITGTPTSTTIIYGPDATLARLNNVPALGTDGTNLLVGYVAPTTFVLTQETRATATPGTIASTLTSTTGIGSALQVMSVQAGSSFDFGAARSVWVVGPPTGTQNFYSMTTAGVIQAGEGFTLPASSANSGVVWDGARFVTLWVENTLGLYALDTTQSRSRQRVGKWTTALTSTSLFYAYTWADINAGGTGTHETALSPATSSISVPARHLPAWPIANQPPFLTSVTQGPPQVGASDTDAADTFNLYASSSGAGGTYHFQVQAASTALWVEGLLGLAGAAPPANSTFPLGAAGVLNSKTGGFLVKGDGTGAWPYLQAQHDLRYAALGHDHDLIYRKTLPGEMIMYGGNGTPTGWLKCDGSFVNISTYPDLFAVIEHTFNGGTDPDNGTFKLPDMRDNFPIGVSGTKGIGTAGGSATLPDHSHGAGSYVTDTFTHTQATNTTITGTNNRLTGPAGHSHNVTGTSGLVSGANPSIIPPYRAVNFLIKT